MTHTARVLGSAYASTMGSMRVEPQQLDGRPTEDRHGGSMNLPTSVKKSQPELVFF
jgi:hypothetical protein